MIIYVKLRYTLIGTEMKQTDRTNYSSYEKAKRAVKEYVEDFENHIDKEEEHLDTNGSILYEIHISWDSYYGKKNKEIVKIKREYVY